MVVSEFILKFKSIPYITYIILVWAISKGILNFV